jgi:hypothetical protein
MTRNRAGGLALAKAHADMAVNFQHRQGQRQRARPGFSPFAKEYSTVFEIY